MAWHRFAFWSRLGGARDAMLVVASLACAILQSRTANAQACTDGRVASDLTVYHCCWPGQVWSDERARCIGPPICPDDRVATGEECVRTQVLPMQWVTPTEEVTVTLHAPRDRPDEPVTLMGDHGNVAAVCMRAPCVRRVPPGRYAFVLGPRWRYASGVVEVPTTGGSFAPQRVPRWRVGTYLGVAAIGTMTSLLILSLAAETRSFEDACFLAGCARRSDHSASDREFAAGALWGGGALAMWIAGAVTAAVNHIVVRRIEPSRAPMYDLALMPISGGAFASVSIRPAGL